ncbi:MAG: bacteriophage abortive infection AbiH family protein [Rikenellaceae bacterium]|jgi:hypothetical protein|nr:bacteriophage abortive infection AbiH family protein [Rikenellaceae bacterium]
MNIVYLIGNGFDINLGMKTGYKDFYNYYLNLPKDGDSDVIKSFKEELETERFNNFDNWSDLELALGGYLEFLDTEQAVELYEHLVEKLSEYIKLEEERWPFNVDKKNLFCEHLISSWQKLYPAEITAINTYLSQWHNQTWNIQIITFNYSRSIERIIQNQPPLLIKRRPNGSETYLRSIEHIHGYVEERMILGVNDTSQIANEKLRGESRVTERYVKSERNKRCRTEHDAKCKKWIEEANLICTFGVSYGDTDKKWWEAIGTPLKKGCKMILFAFNNEKVFTGNQINLKYEEEDRIKDHFLKQAGLQDTKNNIKENIYVAYNTNMFKLDIGKRVDDRKEEPVAITVVGGEPLPFPFTGITLPKQ